MTALSHTPRVIGPTWSSDHESASTPLRLKRPYVGLWPTSPVIDAGPRIEPPVSEPSAPAHSPAAAATAEPDDEPAGARRTSHGLRPVGNGPSVTGRPNAHSCIASLPRSTAPASLSRRVTNASRAGT